MNQLKTITKLLDNTKRIAVVGFSSKSHKAGYYVPEYLEAKGYEIIPVNPYISQGLDHKAYDTLAEVPGELDMVLLFRRPEYVAPFVDQAIELGAKSVWMQLGIRDDQAAQLARDAGLDVVQNACMLAEHQRLHR